MSQRELPALMDGRQGAAFDTAERPAASSIGGHDRRDRPPVEPRAPRPATLPLASRRAIAPSSRGLGARPSPHPPANRSRMPNQRPTSGGSSRIGPAPVSMRYGSSGQEGSPIETIGARLASYRNPSSTSASSAQVTTPEARPAPPPPGTPPRLQR